MRTGCSEGIFGPRGAEILGAGENCMMNGFIKLYPLPNRIVMIKSKGMILSEHAARMETKAIG